VAGNLTLAIPEVVVLLSSSLKYRIKCRAPQLNNKPPTKPLFSCRLKYFVSIQWLQYGYFLNNHKPNTARVVVSPLAPPAQHYRLLAPDFHHVWHDSHAEYMQNSLQPTQRSTASDKELSVFRDLSPRLQHRVASNIHRTFFNTRSMITIKLHIYSSSMWVWLKYYTLCQAGVKRVYDPINLGVTRAIINLASILNTFQ
jgi:hypothetical protein